MTCLLPSCVHSWGMHWLAFKGLGAWVGRAQALVCHWCPLLEEPTKTATVGSSQALARPATQSSWPQGTCLSLSMGPTVSCSLAPGWVCVLPVSSGFPSQVYGVMERYLGSGDQGAQGLVLLCYRLLCDLGRSPHLSGL